MPDVCVEILEADVFFDDRHRLIYRADAATRVAIGDNLSWARLMKRLSGKHRPAQSDGELPV
jgi:hypothetical protein